MESVTIDGVSYVKASVLAKKHNYTADYIGQLCRAKKVDAHLVGRTWYVYPPSLEGHKDTRYSELRASEKINKIKVNRESFRIDVVSVTNRVILKPPVPNFQHRVNWKSSSYENDASDLLPSISKPQEPVRMQVNLAGSEKVKVVSASRNITMVSQPLPAISLSGTLKVQDFNPEFEVADLDEGSIGVDKYSYNVVDSEDVGLNSAIHHVSGQASDERQKSIPTIRSNPHDSSISRLVSHTRSPRPRQPQGDFSLNHTEVSGVFSTHTPPRHANSTSVALVQAVPPQSLVFRLVVVPATLVLVISVVSALLLVETVVVSGGGSQVATIQIDTNFFAEFIAIFSKN